MAIHLVASNWENEIIIIIVIGIIIGINLGIIIKTKGIALDFNVEFENENNTINSN